MKKLTGEQNDNIVEHCFDHCKFIDDGKQQRAYVKIESLQYWLDENTEEEGCLNAKCSDGVVQSGVDKEGYPLVDICPYCEDT